MGLVRRELFVITVLPSPSPMYFHRIFNVYVSRELLKFKTPKITVRLNCCAIIGLRRMLLSLWSVLLTKVRAPSKCDQTISLQNKHLLKPAPYLWPSSPRELGYWPVLERENFTDQHYQNSILSGNSDEAHHFKANAFISLVQKEDFHYIHLFKLEHQSEIIHENWIQMKKAEVSIWQRVVFGFYNK